MNGQPMTSSLTNSTAEDEHTRVMAAATTFGLWNAHQAAKQLGGIGDSDNDFLLEINEHDKFDLSLSNIAQALCT
jgi:hypothetical protein